MTPKEQAAMQLALKAMKDASPYGLTFKEAIIACEEALDHSGEANEMVGCAYCNNPLFAGTKCNNCGLVTLAEQAEQEPVALLQLAEDALVYHTEQTRPIQNTIDALAAIQKFKEKQR